MVYYYHNRLQVKINDYKETKMNYLTIKSTITYKNGKTVPAAPANEKQTKYAQDILARINAALTEVAEAGAPVSAQAIADEMDKQTCIVESGPRDIINYLASNNDRCSIIQRCYTHAVRAIRNAEEENALRPLLEACIEEFNKIPRSQY